MEGREECPTRHLSIPLLDQMHRCEKALKFELLFFILMTTSKRVRYINLSQPASSKRFLSRSIVTHTTFRLSALLRSTASRTSQSYLHPMEVQIDSKLPRCCFSFYLVYKTLKSDVAIARNP